MAEVWILGGTGRVGSRRRRGLAASRVSTGARRPRRRPAAGGRGAAGTRRTSRPTLDAVAAGIRAARPVGRGQHGGPFTPHRAAASSTPASPPGATTSTSPTTSRAVAALLDRGAEAERAGRTLVTGAGFGVVATESVVAWLCRRRHRGSAGPRRPGPDGHAAVAGRCRPGALGEALAGTLVEGLPGFAGRRSVPGSPRRGGRLRRAPLGGEVRDARHAGRRPRLSTGLMPLGRARRRAAGQRRAGRRVGLERGAARAGWYGRPPARRRPARGRSAAPVRRPPARGRPPSRPAGTAAHSWGHAVVTWDDGTTSEGWLRLPEAQATTDAVAAEVARRLVHGEGRPGAFTPAALFGTGLADRRSAAPTPVPGPERPRDRRPTGPVNQALGSVAAGHVPRRPGALPRSRRRGGRRRGARGRAQPGRRDARVRPPFRLPVAALPHRARHDVAGEVVGGRRRASGRGSGRRPRRGLRGRAGAVPQRPRARRVPAVRRRWPRT